MASTSGGVSPCAGSSLYAIVLSWGSHEQPALADVRDCACIGRMACIDRVRHVGGQIDTRQRRILPPQAASCSAQITDVVDKTQHFPDFTPPS